MSIALVFSFVASAFRNIALISRSIAVTRAMIPEPAPSHVTIILPENDLAVSEVSTDRDDRVRVHRGYERGPVTRIQVIGTDTELVPELD